MATTEAPFAPNYGRRCYLTMPICSNLAVSTPLCAKPMTITPNTDPSSFYGYAPMVIFRSPLLSDFIYNDFLPAKSILKKTTLAGYERDIKLRIIPYLGRYRLIQIDHAAIQGMINECASRKIATNARETLSSILGYACEKFLLPYNAATGRYLYPDQMRRSQEPFLGLWLTSFDQIALWLDIARNECPGSAVEKMMLLGFCQGLRKSEFLGIDGEYIDLANDNIFVCQAYTKAGGPPELHGTKTDQSTRLLPMVGYVRERILDIGVGKGPWITDKNGNRYDPQAAYKVFERFRLKHGLPHVTTATLRHSFATSCLRAGMDIATLQLWLGHTDPKTTLTYTKATFSDMCEDVPSLNAILYSSLACLGTSMRSLARSKLDSSNISPANLTGGLFQPAQSNTPKMTPKMTPKNCPESMERSKMAQLVLDAIITNQKISRQQIADRYNVSLSTVRRAVDELKEQGIISYTGSSKKGHWTISLFD